LTENRIDINCISMTKRCRNCRSSVSRSNAKFCRRQCCIFWHNRNRVLKPNVEFVCKMCGKTVRKYVEPFKQKLSSYTQEFCDRTCAGHFRVQRNHPNWKGGMHESEGYRYIHCPDHPSVKSKRRKYVLEHRLVMEKHLGRYLTDDEVVHHDNDDGLDNRIGNLILCRNQSEHKKIHDPKRKRDAYGRYLAVHQSRKRR